MQQLGYVLMFIGINLILFGLYLSSQCARVAPTTYLVAFLS